MAGKKKPAKSEFIKALEFISLAQHSNGSEASIYCQMQNQHAVAFDMVIAIGTHIEEDIQACPQTSLLLAAMERCGPSYALTQLTLEKLLVKSEDFQAYIPCLRPDLLSAVIPDAPLASLDDRFLVALKKVAPLARIAKKDDPIIECSIQIQPCSVLATNRAVIFEAWHGNDMPSGLLLPKRAATVLAKANKSLMSFGFSKTTMTFYFKDNSWMRTQLYQDRWPEVQKHLHNEPLTAEVPPMLFEAAKRVAPFSPDERVHISKGLISSHPFNVVQQGSELRLPIGAEAHQDRIYNVSSLALVSKHALKWDEAARTDGTAFTGENIRGLISHEHFSEPISEIDDDIPF